MNQAPTTLKIPQQMLDDIIRHAFERAPEECVGVLASPWSQEDQGEQENSILEVTALVKANNKAMKPKETFWVDPEEHINIILALEEENLDLTVVYHSHLSSPPYPSVADQRMAADRVMLIVSLEFPESPQVMAWWQPPRTNDQNDQNYAAPVQIAVEATLENEHA